MWFENISLSNIFDSRALNLLLTVFFLTSSKNYCLCAGFVRIFSCFARRQVQVYWEMWRVRGNVSWGAIVKYVPFKVYSALCIYVLRWFLSSGKQKAYRGTINTWDGPSTLQSGYLNCSDDSLHLIDHHLCLLHDQLNKNTVYTTWKQMTHSSFVCICPNPQRIHLDCHHGNTNWFSRMTNDTQSPRAKVILSKRWKCTVGLSQGS